MASHWTCPLFLKVALVCLPFTVTGNADNNKSILVERSFSPVRRSAWVAPRMTCARQGDRRSRAMPTWDASYATSPVGYDGRGDGNGAAGNQASILNQLVTHRKLQRGRRVHSHHPCVSTYSYSKPRSGIPRTQHQARQKWSACTWIRGQERRVEVRFTDGLLGQVAWGRPQLSHWDHQLATCL